MSVRPSVRHTWMFMSGIPSKLNKWVSKLQVSLKALICYMYMPFWLFLCHFSEQNKAIAWTTGYCVNILSFLSTPKNTLFLSLAVDSSACVIRRSLKFWLLSLRSFLSTLSTQTKIFAVCLKFISQKKYPTVKIKTFWQWVIWSSLRHQSPFYCSWHLPLV